MNNIKLKVMEALQEEAYKGIVRIDSQTMKEIGVHPGDVLEIQGNRLTVGIVDRAYPTDVGQNIIRMDGILRRNAKTGIGENIGVKKADIKEAKQITIAPAQKGVMIRADSYLFKKTLLGRAMITGDIIVPGGSTRRRRTMSDSPFFDDIFSMFDDMPGSFGLGSLRFMVVNTNPKSPVIITENTQVNLSPKAVEITEEKIPEVTYEDIGGLSDETKKIREMVELPLKHPEIFNKLGIEPPKGVLLHGPPGTGKTLLAKAVANESEANFILVNGPEIVNKFYGECVAEDSIVLTNGSGLKTIKEAVNDKESKHIAGVNMKTQKAEILPISDVFDKGKQNTLKIKTPHGKLELTPTSKLLKLNELEPEWCFVKNLKEGDQVAISKKLPIVEKIPSTVDFYDDKTILKGKVVEDLLNLYEPKEIASKLKITQKKYIGHRYNKTAPSWLIKKLLKISKKQINDSFELSRQNRKLPSKLDEKLMYVLGLLAGDGHLRYSYKDKHVTSISLSNSDKEVINLYKKYLKDLFNVKDIKSRGKYDYSFDSPAIGTFLSNLGLPYRNKSRTVSLPDYLVFLPEKFIVSYLKGIYDTDGYVHLPPSGKQVIYYTMSKKMANSLNMILLRFKIQSNMRKKKDGTYEISINEKDSINIFKEKIGFNHLERKSRLNKEIKTKYTKSSYNRIPINNYLKNIIKKLNISKRYFLLKGINLNVKGLDTKQVSKLINILSKKGVNKDIINKIKLLNENDILWSPIRKIEESKSHVYDFTVPKNHNFIANGFIVHNSEKKIRQIFESAEKNAPSIIFFDELDSIAPKREETYGELERRVVSQILTQMDGLKNRGKVIVIGATNRPNSLDPALRRPGRFDREISISVPNKKGRLNILKIHTRTMPLTKDVNLNKLAEITHGFVGADIAALCKEAAMNVLRRVLPDLKLGEKEQIPKEIIEKLIVRDKDFREALKFVRPSALREVLVEAPNVKWEDVGGAKDIEQELKEAVEWPLKHPDAFKKIGVKAPKGILLYGPPGTGKTLLAKAVANESEGNFILVRGPELLNKFIGESEKGIRKVFEKARQASPTIIFFDELDSLVPRRGTSNDSQVTERVVNTVLSEMDGLEELNDVIVIAATNRPDMIDPALLRPGRFDRLLFVGAPDKKERLEILKIHTKNMPLNVDKRESKEMEKQLKEEDLKIISKMASDEAISQEEANKLNKNQKKPKKLSDKDMLLYYIAEKTEGYTGADLEAIAREAGLLALRADIKSKTIKKKFFDEALKKVRASVSKELLAKYKSVEENYLRQAKAAITKEIPSYMG